MTSLVERIGQRRADGRAVASAAILVIGLVACGDSGTGPPPPGGSVTLDLAVGESALLTEASQVRSFAITGGDGDRRYDVIVQQARSGFGPSQTMRLTVTAGGAAASAVDAQRVRTALQQLPPGTDFLTRRQNALRFEDRLRESTRREALRVGARSARPPEGRDPGARFSVVRDPLTAGQSVTFKLGVTVDLQANCSSTETIDTEIRWVGDNFAIAEDVQVAGHLTPEDFEGLGTLLDETIYPVETAYFGSTADIDENGVVVALITAEVNRTTPRNAGYTIGGFFFGGDLLDATQCPASNEGELFYLIAPDPGGVYSNSVSVDEAISLARQVVSHEFFHLIGNQQRTTLGGGGVLDEEDAWLDEGLAHFAEELIGMAVVGKSLRSNLDLEGVAPSGEPVANAAFNDFHLANLQRAARFMLDPDGTLALGTQSGADPPGTETLKMRGFGYLFARWLGDQFGPAGSGIIPGSGEEALFRELASGGPAFLAGPENVERAVQVVGGASRSWEELVSGFLGMLAVDDADVSGLDPAFSSLTWNYPDLFGQLSEEEFVDPDGNPVPPPSELRNPYPLIPTFLSISESTNTSRSFSTNPSTGAFFTLSSVGSAPDLTVEVTNGTGGMLDPTLDAQVLVIRTR